MLNCGFQFFHHARLALALAVFPIRADVFWPYFSCAILSVIGLTKIIRDELPQKHGLEKTVPFGRLFYAMPMGVFATQHFTNTVFVASIVPSWMPVHTFVVYRGALRLLPSPEHHPRETCTAGGHTFGMHVSTFRGFDAYP